MIPKVVIKFSKKKNYQNMYGVSINQFYVFETCLQIQSFLLQKLKLISKRKNVILHLFLKNTYTCKLF